MRQDDLAGMREVRSLDVVLPTGCPAIDHPAQAIITRSEIRLRTVSRPEPHLAILLGRLDLPLPNRSKKIHNVVEKIAQKSEIRQQMEIFNL